MTAKYGRIALVIILAAALAGVACERVAPVRTLPSWVRGVHVPMVVNESYEPGLEETATRLIQEALLADGRLDVVPANSADLVLRARITDWRRRTSGTSGDDIADRYEYRVTAQVELFEPRVDEPMASLGDVMVLRSFNSDARSVDFVPEPDRRRELLRELAERVVAQTISGFPAELRRVPLAPAAGERFVEPFPHTGVEPLAR